MDLRRALISAFSLASCQWSHESRERIEVNVANPTLRRRGESIWVKGRYVCSRVKTSANGTDRVDPTSLTSQNPETLDAHTAILTSVFTLVGKAKALEK